MKMKKLNWWKICSTWLYYLLQTRKASSSPSRGCMNGEFINIIAECYITIMCGSLWLCRKKVSVYSFQWVIGSQYIFSLAKYSKFSVSHKLEKYLGDVESNIDRAREKGSERQVDQHIASLVGKPMPSTALAYSIVGCIMFIFRVCYPSLTGSVCSIPHWLVIGNSKTILLLQRWRDGKVNISYSVVYGFDSCTSIPVVGDTFLTRRVVRPSTNLLANMTGGAMWNTFINTQSEGTAADSTPAERRSASATQLEDQLDLLTADFSTMCSDLSHKQVKAL